MTGLPVGAGNDTKGGTGNVGRGRYGDGGEWEVLAVWPPEVGGAWARGESECGTRVLPFKYLERLLQMYGLRAEVVRPSLDGWNALSCSTTLEKLREEAGEKVCRLRGRDRKE